MSFFRKKSGLEIPPVPDPVSTRNHSGSTGTIGRAASPQPPPYSYSTAASSVPSDRFSGTEGSSRGIASDPYARSGNAEADRHQLFSGYVPAKAKVGSSFATPSDRFGGPGGDGNEPEQFQTQEDEDEEVEGIKQQTRFIKQDSVNSTRNALRIAREAEETARNTLLKLGDQSEKLANTERHIDMGKAHALRAEDRTDELKQLNRSIFRPVIVFNKDAKRAANEAKIKARYDEQQEQREKALKDVRDSQNRIGSAVAYGRDGSNGEETLSGRRVLAPEVQRTRQEQRKRYQFEKTASDDELEDELDDNLDAIAQATKGLHAIALAASDELDKQNVRIDDISTKTGKLTGRVDVTTDRLRRIK